MKIKYFLLLTFLFINIYSFSQKNSIVFSDSSGVINGDTVILNNYTVNRRPDGLYLSRSGLLKENVEYLVYNVMQFRHGVHQGMLIEYNEQYQVKSCKYVRNVYPMLSDSLPDGEIYDGNVLNTEGVVVDGSLFENRIIAFSVVDQENKTKTSFILDKHSRISKRLFYDNKEKPCRIVFFTKKMKIKGDFQIEEIDLKHDYLKYKYWNHK